MSSNKKQILKRVFLAVLFLILAGAGIVWYMFTKTFANTANAKADYIVEAPALLHEYSINAKAANIKYTEKIITVSGRVSEVEAADTTVNIKMADSTGAYIIFAFQKNDIAAAKKLKEGDAVSIKGSCNGGTYSDILETIYVAFKRCSINQ